MDRTATHRCNRYREAVSLELDGELSQFEHAFLRTHGARCADCRRFRVDATAITQDLRSAPLEVPRRRVSVAAHRRRRIGVHHASAIAASMLVVSLGALYAADVGVQGQDGTPVRSTVRPAYFDSPEYELSLLRAAVVYNSSGRVIRL